MNSLYPKTKTNLNQLVADISQLTLIVHQTHWYMRGKTFFTMHPKMDELMADLDDQLDQIAERLIAIGGEPLSTFGEFLETTKLEEKKGKFGIPMENLIQHLVEDYRYLRDVFQEGIDISGEEDDYSTQDMLIGMKTDVEKTIWMLQAFLDKSPLAE